MLASPVVTDASAPSPTAVFTVPPFSAGNWVGPAATLDPSVSTNGAQVSFARSEMAVTPWPGGQPFPTFSVGLG